MEDIKQKGEHVDLLATSTRPLRGKLATTSGKPRITIGVGSAAKSESEYRA
jgi:hypothetical protein